MAEDTGSGAFIPTPEVSDQAAALRAAGRPADAEHALGVAAYQSGAFQAAVAHVRRAIALDPNAAAFHANLSEMLRRVGDPAGAEAAARRALALAPGMPGALTNLGVALYERGDYAGAVEAHRGAIAADPAFAEAHSNLGNALHALRRYADAQAALERAVALRPTYADAWANLGTTLHHAGRFDAAAAALRRAIALAPGHANAHTGLGLLLLMRGDFAEGWEEYAWRAGSSEMAGATAARSPWSGEPLAGRSILIAAEQGLGDTLQFVRYIPLLQALGASVSLRAPAPLVRLLQQSLPGVRLAANGEAAPEADFDAALLDLPRRFRTRLETIPAGGAYLAPPADAAARWRERLAKLSGVRVGLAWAGNRAHVNDAGRSIRFATLAPVLKTAGAAFVSLQAGEPAAEARVARAQVEPLSDELLDFAETAAALSALDLVITVDTAVAHLAGALAKPVWLLTPAVADWRWLTGREDSPWYPTMRLFRQRDGEPWNAVARRVGRALARAAAGHLDELAPHQALNEARAAAAAATIALELRRAAPTPSLSAADPAEAAHALGVAAHLAGRSSEAIEHLERAVALAPDRAVYHANLGEMLRLAGRPEAAIAEGRAALALDPGNAPAASNMGIALFDLGRYEEALAAYDQAIAARPDFDQAHSNRGNVLQRLKRFDEAEPSYRRALALQPGFADAWNNLGTCLRELGRPEEAEAVYRKALELAPNGPETLDNLALALKDLRRFDEAADLLRRAIALEPARAKFHLHLGAVLLDLDQTGEAGAATERALALEPDSHEAVNQLGRVAFDRGELEAALALYARALELKPDLAEAYNNMGNALRDLGRLDEARAAFLACLELDPTMTGAYVNLTDSTRLDAHDPHLAAMEALAARDDLSKPDRMHIGFALGKAYADLKDYDRSFDHLLAANAAKRATIDYDEGWIMALFDRLEALFTPAFIEARSGGGDPSPTPVFIIGMPRSGTTLVEQIIASHPRAHGAGELATFNEVVSEVSNGVQFPDSLASIDAEKLRRIGAAYLARLRALAPDSERITDKMPSNYFFAGLIHLALPNATMIHCVRDPVDTCVSCFSKLFVAEQKHTFDLGELGRYYRRYERLMAHWRRVLPPGRVLDVRYEEVVADLDAQARRIVAHSGLAWDDRCLAFHATDRPVRTASATQVRRPLYASSVGRWRAYGEHLAPLLAALGAG